MEMRGGMIKNEEWGKTQCFPTIPITLTKLSGIQLDVSSSKTATLIRRTPSLSEMTPCSGQKMRRGRRAGILRIQDAPELGMKKAK